MRLLLLAGLTLLSACAAKQIPGTQIADTRDSRAILEVMERYRAALEAKDSKRILSLVSKNFRDDAGTDSPEDDLRYSDLPAQLDARLAQLSDLKLELNIRKVTVVEKEAAAIYYWNASFRMPKLSGKNQNEAELEQMLFEKVDGDWKIVSGI